MRARTATAALAAVLLLTAGCTGSSGDKAEPAPTVSKEDKFLADLNDTDITSWNDKRPADEEILLFPEDWCAGLKKGHSVEYLFGDGGGLYPIGSDWGTKKDDAYTVLVLAVTAYCPEHRDAVTEELRESGDY
jgi:hypothetical protein